MKKIYTFAIICFFILSCKKEITGPASDAYLQNVKTALKDSLTTSDFSNLDFTKAIINRVDSVSLYFLRVPFKEKSITSDFVIVKTDKEGRVDGGKIIHLEGSVTNYSFNGSTVISSLNRLEKLSSPVENGYITAFHSLASERVQTKLPDDLPEVVIVTYVHRTPDFSTWYWLNGLMSFNNMQAGEGGGGNYYGTNGGETGPGYSGDGGVGGGSYSDAPGRDETIYVDVDTYVDKTPIDIKAFLKCFENIPDEGATCSIEIFADIPVDNDPTKLFNWQARTPGHVFLQLKKTSADGNQSVMQNIGFYPKSNWKNILDASPVPGKMVDDGSHEFNASLLMNVNANRFSSALGKIKELSSLNYDMDEFNCTDFALEVFNYIRTPLQIPRYAIPGASGMFGSNTPQGLFIKLQEMKTNGDPESANIKLPGIKGWVSDSQGPCN